MSITANTQTSLLNEGLHLQKSGYIDKAEEIYLKILESEPNNAEALHLLGTIFIQKKNYNNAVACIGKAIGIKPNSPNFHCNIANAFMHLNQADTALDFYKKAIHLKADYMEAYKNLGIILHEMSQWENEIELYEKYLSIDKKNGIILNQLIKVLKGCCHFSKLEKYSKYLIETNSKSIAKNGVSFITPFNSLSFIFSENMQQRIAKAYVQQNFSHFTKIRSNLGFSFPATEYAGNKLRIGYVSSDFRNHPTAHLMKQLFKLHDRNSFEIFTYCIGSDDNSEYRKFIREHSDHFIELSNLNDIEAATRIYSDKIHILADVMGYIQNARTEIFALKPAPIQINYLAYPGTMGSDFIDYIISDEESLPPASASFYNEKIKYLPSAYFVTDNTQKIGKAKSKKEYGLPDNKFIFCSFNKSYKINEHTIRIWVKLLQQAENSVLWLFSENSLTKKNILEYISKSKVDPTRIIFAERTEKSEHLARHKYADLFLDSFAYNAHTTAIDALWAGTPVLTMKGNTLATRASSSILDSAGLDELITKNKKEFIETALHFYNDNESLKNIKSKIQQQVKKSALFNTESYVKSLEEIYKEICKDNNYYYL